MNKTMNTKANDLTSLRQQVLQFMLRNLIPTHNRIVVVVDGQVNGQPVDHQVINTQDWTINQIKQEPGRVRILEQKIESCQVQVQLVKI